MRLLGESTESRPQLAHDEGSITLLSKSRGVPCGLRRGGKLGARQEYDEGDLAQTDGLAQTVQVPGWGRPLAHRGVTPGSAPLSLKGALPRRASLLPCPSPCRASLGNH